MKRVHAAIATTERHDSYERCTGLGVEVVQGCAKITNLWTVQIALRGGGKPTLTRPRSIGWRVEVCALAAQTAVLGAQMPRLETRLRFGKTEPGHLRFCGVCLHPCVLQPVIASLSCWIKNNEKKCLWRLCNKRYKLQIE
jgi:hypothetical protein